MVEMTDFQKAFLAKGTGQTLFTQKEFDEALALAQAEIMAMAIETTRTAIKIERDECAKLAEDAEQTELANKIRNRIPSQNN
jgi:hypothetical protein